MTDRVKNPNRRARPSVAIFIIAMIFCTLAILKLMQHSLWRESLSQIDPGLWIFLGFVALICLLFIWVECLHLINVYRLRGLPTESRAFDCELDSTVPRDLCSIAGEGWCRIQVAIDPDYLHGQTEFVVHILLNECAGEWPSSELVVSKYIDCELDTSFYLRLHPQPARLSAVLADSDDERVTIRLIVTVKGRVSSLLPVEEMQPTIPATQTDVGR